MKATMKRITALALSLVMLFSVIPVDAAPWDPWGFFPFFSPWFDPVSGVEMTEAKTVAASDDGTAIMYVGEQKEWNGTLDSTNPNSDPSVATAEKTGDNKLLIKAQQKDGFTTLRFTGTAFCTVRVIKPSVELTKSVITVEPGSEYYLRAKTNCREEDGDGALTWSSSDPSVVTVDDTGKLTIGVLADNQESATAKITCEMKYTTHDLNGTKTTKYVTTECAVTVKRFLKSISLDTANLEMYTDDEPVTVNITGCNPAYFYTDETIADMEIYSTKESVLTVAANGKELMLTPKGKGTAKVVVSYTNENGERVEAYVIVKVLDEGLDISPAYMELPAGSTAAVVADVHPARKASSVKVTSSDPSVATAEWNAGDTQAVIRGLSVGTTELTFTMGSLKCTAKITVTEPIGKDVDLYTVSFVDYDGKVLCTKETVLSTAEAPNTVTIPTVGTKRDGYTFDHFERDNAPGVAYYAGTELEVTGNMTLTAVYVPGTCVITYKDTTQSAGFGVNLPAAEDVHYGDLATKPIYGIGSDGKAIEKEVRENNQSRYYRFIGWQTEDGTRYTFTDPVLSSLTLYPIWEKVYCVITKRTFKGAYPDHDTGIITVEKGTEGLDVSDLKMFTESDGDFYTYTYTNSNGVGKVVYFQFWQYGSERVTSGSYHFDKIMDDATFTAVYEPGNPRSVGGTAVNDSTSSYYHSTNVYVPVNWKRTDNDVVVLDDMVQTNVYPQYGLKTSNVYGMVYEYHTPRDAFPEQDQWDQLSPNFDAFGTRFNVSGHDTAKFGLINLSDMVGTEITGTDGKNYIVTGIDQSKVEAVWLCTCDGHTFNGYCLGGTWNAIGQVTLYVEEKLKAAPKIKVNYYLLPEAENEEQRDAYRSGIVTEEQKNKARLQDITSSEVPVDEVLTYKDYVENINGIWPAVDHDWIEGTEGQLTTENGEYVLNLYYADIFYRVKVYYHYVTKPEDAGNTSAPLVPAADLGSNGVNPWTNNDHHYYYNDKFEKQTPIIADYVADRTTVTGKFTDHDIEEHVYYEPIVTIYYKALTGGKVTTAGEDVRQFTGTAVGSTAVADTANSYVVKGWYADEKCATQLLDAGNQTSKKFVPQRPSTGWVDGTTFWARFIKEIVITSADGTWPYDGTVHTNPTYTVTYGGEPVTAVSADGKVFTLPTGDTVTITPTAKGVTKTGDSDEDNNTFTYTVTTKYDDYKVSTVLGDLSITPAVLEISSADKSWTYNGAARTNPVYSVSLNEKTVTSDSTVTTVVLPTGDTLTLTQPASVTHVSETDEDSEKENNTFAYALDQNADQYTIKTSYGNLVIDPAPLTVITDSATKVYDGQPLTADGKVEGFMTGDTYSFATTGSQTDLGSSPNPYSLSYTGTTQSTDYKIVKEDLGILTVIPSKMSIQSPNGEWTYNAEGHQTDTMEVKYGGNSVTVTKGTDGRFTGTLPTGDVLTIIPKAEATVTHVYETTGKTENNTFIWSVATAGGTDRTDFYKDTTTVAYGDLTVKPAPVTLISGNAEKAYDGNALTNDGVPAAEKKASGLTTDSGWIGDEGVTCTFTGTQTAVGSSNNTFTYAAKAGTDLRDYTVTPAFGTLTVTPKALTIESPNGEWDYSGEGHQTETMKVTYGSETVTMTRGTDGKFTGSLGSGDILTVTPDDAATVTHVADTEGKTENNTFTWSVAAADGTSKTDLYKDTTTVTYGDLTVNPIPVTLISGNAEKAYDGNALTNDGVPAAEKKASGLTTDSGWIGDEGVTCTFTGTQTAVGSSDNTFTYAAKAGTDLRDYTVTEDYGTLTVTPKALTIESPNGEWDYSGEGHQTETMKVTYGGETVTMTRGTDGKFTGSLGSGDILTVTPDDAATVTHVADTEGKTENNTFTWSVAAADGTSKTDLYKDTTTVSYGDLIVIPLPLIIVTNSDEKFYDTTPLTASGKVEGFMDGETYTFSTTGSQTVPGESDNTYDLVFDGTADPDDYYIASEDIGTLTVVPKEITIKSPDGKWTYDGKPHCTETITVTYGGYEIPMTRGSDGSFTGTLPTGDKITVMPTADATVTHVGETKGEGDNTYTWTVENPDCYPDVKTTYGDLTITPAPLIIATGSAAKVYDGEPLTAGGKVEGFAEGDTYTFKVIGSQTEVGSSDNNYTLDFDGTADPDDYYIADEKIGLLRVIPEHKVIVHYWEEKIGGHPIHPDAVAVYDEGEQYHIPSPVIPGYTADVRIVEGTMGSHDVVYDVIYTPVEHTLVVRYVDEDGNPVHDPHTETHKTGEHYEVESPVIEGYTTTTKIVEGDMPGHDTVITVIYFKPTDDLVSISDYDTPMSIGGLNVNAGDCYE